MMREIKFRAKRIDNGEWAESASVSKSEKLFGEVLWFIGAGQPAEQASADEEVKWYCEKWKGHPMVDPTDYCSKGERREGE